MKSMSLLFLLAACLALWAGAAGLESSGKSLLVSQSLSAQTWTRTCAYVAPGGVRTLAVDAADACPAVLPADAPADVQQAWLAE